MLNVDNFDLLTASEKLNRIEKGEMAFVNDIDGGYYMYDGERWNKIENPKVEADGLSMNLYDLNKSIFSQLPPLTVEQYQEKTQLINEYNNFYRAKYYMLLCNDIHYYTIFNNTSNPFPEFDTLGSAVITVLRESFGDFIKSIEKTQDESAIEIWVQREEDNLCFYLFNCDKMFVDFGG